LESEVFAPIKAYHHNPYDFSVHYERTTNPRMIPQEVQANILRELRNEKQLIEDKDVPLSHYNCSYVSPFLKELHHQKVSLSTIIHGAKKPGFYVKRKPRKAPHDREVLTKYIREIIQHDSSYHLWSPLAREKWYLLLPP